MSTYDILHKFAAETSQIVRFVYFRSLPRAEQELVPLKVKLLVVGEAGRGFYDALRGIYMAARERESSSLFIRLYRQANTGEIQLLSDKFKYEAYRSTTDDYERGFLIAWEIASKTLADLKKNYPEYPLKDTPQTSSKKPDEEEQSDFEVMPRKKIKSQ